MFTGELCRTQTSALTTIRYRGGMVAGQLWLKRLSPQTCQCPKAMKKVCDKLKTVWAHHVKKFIPSSRSMKSSARAAKDKAYDDFQNHHVQTLQVHIVLSQGV